MIRKSAVTEGLASLPERLRLRSRFGQRLLLLFMGCAMIPTCAVALLSFRSVTSQLAAQSVERLSSLAVSAGRTIYGRLAFLENDLVRLAPRLDNCQGCGAALLYAAEAIVEVPDVGAIRLVAGSAEEVRWIGAAELPALEPNQSAVFTRSNATGGIQFVLVHRPERAAGSTARVVARISPAYLWSQADEEALPGNVHLELRDSLNPVLVAPGAGTLRSRATLQSEWSLPQAHRFRLPPWKVVVREPRDEVMAPMASFAESFPLFLAVALLVVLVLGVVQIRRSLHPLAELQSGTRRIAARDFDSTVEVRSGDEFEELAGAFNSMTAQLGRQFNALETAAEIDRAVLSSVDASAIVQAVLDRVPEVTPCDGISVTLLNPGAGEPGTTWVSFGTSAGPTRIKAELGPDDMRWASRSPDRLSMGPGGAPLPGYLAHFAVPDQAVRVEAFPLRYGGELLGVIALRTNAGHATDDDMVQVRRIADQVAVGLSNARMVDQVRFLAFFDSLTRLPNRVLYKERLAQALLRAERNGKLVAVCFIDLDHFSRINDTLGHDLGDLLLKEVAARLVGCTRSGDSPARFGAEEGVPEVSRLGGDEFTVVLPDLTDPHEAVRVSRRVLETFRRPMRLGSQEIFVTASIGIAVYPFDGAEIDDLLKNADVAMYHAKDQGRNTYQLYSASMNAEAMARMHLEHQLRKAVEAREFTIWYQPIVDLETGKPVGAEALVRWAHPERGLVSPGEFIALCEECGLIVPLGEWILRTVCAQARTWEAEGLGIIRMSVNLSARQLRHDGIVDTVRNILTETGLRPRSLVLELTESMLMEPSGVVGRTIRELADLGVSLAIDDFGTGYSSLSYLKNFPVTTLKIDQSFIADVNTNPDDAAITTAIIALARAMELDVVAEGVEREEQAAFLRERGCQKVQGFLVGRPAPADVFAAGLRRVELDSLPEEIRALI